MLIHGIHAPQRADEKPTPSESFRVFRGQTTRALSAALALLLVANAGAVDLKNRSTSRSGQFIVYCDDRDVRGRVVGFVEEVKTDVLHILQEPDGRGLPIVVTLEMADATKAAQPVVVQFTNTVSGPKIDVMVEIGDEPAKVFLQRHIVRALLLDLAYSERGAAKTFVQAPWWVTEGITQNLQRREAGADADLFKNMVNSDKLPAFEKFLTQPPQPLDTAASTVDSACAMALVEALLATPSGPQNLTRFIRRWPDAAGDVLGALAANFPTLNDSPQSLAKWWALQLARFATNDRWLGLSLADTERQLAEALGLDIAISKDPKDLHTQKFSFADYDKFLKLPGTRRALDIARLKVVTLSTKANALYRPILAEYEELCGLLLAGKTKEIAVRLSNIEQYRSSIVQRIGKITDYLNWYEATQTPGRTGSFDDYIRQANKPAPKPAPADPRISEYLDSLEREFAPLRPDTLPNVAPTGSVSR